jgi:hypothetical protein
VTALTSETTRRPPGYTTLRGMTKPPLAGHAFHTENPANSLPSEVANLSPLVVRAAGESPRVSERGCQSASPH